MLPCAYRRRITLFCLEMGEYSMLEQLMISENPDI